MRFWVISVTLLVAGCQTTGMTAYDFRPGATVQQTSRDSFECEVAATQNVPVESRVRSTPAYVTPLHTTCYGASCITTGGQVVGGHVYSYDANKSLRAEYYARCMAERGYRRVDLPRCDRARVPAALKPTLAGRLRPPREGACVSPVTSRTGNVVYSEELAE